jgi:hypothetical protein
VTENQIDARARREGRQPRQEIQRFEDQVTRPVRPFRLELEHNATVLREPEPILGHGGPEQVAAQLLEVLAILSIGSCLGHSENNLWIGTLVTLKNTFWGFLFGVSSGVLTGLVLGRWDLAARFCEPFIVAVNSIPRIALIPFIILMFGLGDLSKIVTAWVIVFFVVFFNTFEGARAVDRDHLAVARLFGAVPAAPAGIRHPEVGCACGSSGDPASGGWPGGQGDGAHAVGERGGRGGNVASPPREAGVLHIVPLSYHPDITEKGQPYLFRTCITSNTNREFVDFMVEKAGIKRVALLGVNDDFGRGELGVFAKRFEALGAKVVSTEFFRFEDRDFSIYLAKIKAAEPDGIYIVARSPQHAMIVNQMKEMDFSSKIFGSGNFSDQELRTLLHGHYAGAFRTPFPYHDLHDGSHRRAGHPGRSRAGRDRPIARGLMSGPKLLMLHEPSLGLGPFLIPLVVKAIQAINREGTTILLVEQNARMALRLSDRGYVLETGRVVRDHTPS